MSNAFRSLGNYNYRLWAGGAVVSNVGTWMQRTAQDWIVFTQLTHNNAPGHRLGHGLQFGPQVFFLPVTGFAADHMDRRKLLLPRNRPWAPLALGLGLLTVTGLVQLLARLRVRLPLGLRGCLDLPGAPGVRVRTGGPRST